MQSPVTPTLTLAFIKLTDKSWSYNRVIWIIYNGEQRKLSRSGTSLYFLINENNNNDNGNGRGRHHVSYSTKNNRRKKVRKEATRPSRH